MTNDEKLDAIYRRVLAMTDDYIELRTKIVKIEETLEEIKLECQARRCHKTLTPLPLVAVHGNGDGEEP